MIRTPCGSMSNSLHAPMFLLLCTLHISLNPVVKIETLKMATSSEYIGSNGFDFWIPEYIEMLIPILVNPCFCRTFKTLKELHIDWHNDAHCYNTFLVFFRLVCDDRFSFWYLVHVIQQIHSNLFSSIFGQCSTTSHTKINGVHLHWVSFNMADI